MKKESSIEILQIFYNSLIIPKYYQISGVCECDPDSRIVSLANFNAKGSICCEEGKVNQNGQCQEKCNEGYENKGGTCECAADFNRLDNFDNMGSICCKEGQVNQGGDKQGGQCQEKCNPGWDNNLGICECGELRSINFNGICCPQGFVVQGNECKEQCNNDMVPVNGICQKKTLKVPGSIFGRGNNLLLLPLSTLHSSNADKT